MNARKMDRFWRFNWREDVWAPTKAKQKKPSTLQKRFLADEITFAEYTAEMDKHENNR